MENQNKGVKKFNKKIFLDYLAKEIDEVEKKLSRKKLRYETMLNCEGQNEDYFNAGYLFALHQMWRELVTEDLNE